MQPCTLLGVTSPPGGLVGQRKILKKSDVESREEWDVIEKKSLFQKLCYDLNVIF